VLLRDVDTGEDSKVAAAAAMDASSAACFLRWKIWPHPRLIRLFLPLASGTVGSVVAALSGEPLRRPGESAHCVLLEPSRRTELVRGSNGESGFEAVVLGVVEELLEASLHSDPELAASRDRPPLASLRRSDGATRPGVSVTPAGLVDGRNRMDRPNAWPPPLPAEDFPIFRASASASAKRGSSVQLRCRERDCGASSLARWSASVAATDDDDDAEDKGDGARGAALFLPLLLPLEVEEGQSVRAMDAAPPEPGAVSDRETERRALWRPGESAAEWGGDRPGSSVPEADAHRFDDDMAARRPASRHGTTSTRARLVCVG
jgi:hypothetical protein